MATSTDVEGRLRLRKKIEEHLWPMVNKAKDDFERKSIEASMDVAERNRLQQEHTATMKIFHRIAEDIYLDVLSGEQALLQSVDGTVVTVQSSEQQQRRIIAAIRKKTAEMPAGYKRWIPKIVSEDLPGIPTHYSPDSEVTSKRFRSHSSSITSSSFTAHRPDQALTRHVRFSAMKPTSLPPAFVDLGNKENESGEVGRAGREIEPPSKLSEAELKAQGSSKGEEVRNRKDEGERSDKTRKTKQDSRFTHPNPPPDGDLPSLCTKLCLFDTTVSPVLSSGCWIEDNLHAIRSIAEKATGFDAQDQAKLTSMVSEIKLYPRLSILALASQMLSPDLTRPSTVLDTAKSWTAWSRLEALDKYKSIYASVWQLINLKIINCARWHYMEWLTKIVVLDMLHLSTLLIDLTGSSATRNEFLNVQGDRAQSFLNLTQELLDLPNLPDHFRPELVTIIRRLSAKSGLHPESFILKDVKKCGNRPKAGGAFGDVWEGVSNGEDVAIKTPRVFGESNIDKVLKDFSAEIIIWRQLVHPNVLPFHGIYYSDTLRTEICLVSAWMENGNITEFLAKTPATERMPLVLDVARGLEYLHTANPKVIHGDLKGANIMISSSGRACLADFGLASIRDSNIRDFTSASKVRSGGTIRWQAPELLDIDSPYATNFGVNTRSSDIWAFACVCYEIFTGEAPFYEMKHDGAVLLAITVKRKRPTRPSSETAEATGLSDSMWALMENCWNDSPSKRPTSTNIVEIIASFSSAYADAPIGWNVSLPPQRLSYFLTENPLDEQRIFKHLLYTRVTASVW